jgi:hypothetical protein
MVRRRDPLLLPSHGLTAEECFHRSAALAGTPGQKYVEGRGISLGVAEAAGVRYVGDWNDGRSAVVAALRDRDDQVVSCHGRYFESRRDQDKMLTIGPGGGLVNVLGGWRVEPLIIVEGLFDALSVAACGLACVATIGRRVPWLAKAVAGRGVWLAFDRSRSGDAEALSYASLMSGSSEARRLLPPGRSKDWNTALLRQGRGAVAQWLRSSVK